VFFCRLNNHGFTREPVPVVGPGAGGGPGEAVRWKQTQLRVQEEETQLTLWVWQRAGGRGQPAGHATQVRIHTPLPLKSLGSVS